MGCLNIFHDVLEIMKLAYHDQQNNLTSLQCLLAKVVRLLCAGALGKEFAVSKWNLTACQLCPRFGSAPSLCYSVSPLILKNMIVMIGKA